MTRFRNMRALLLLLVTTCTIVIGQPGFPPGYERGGAQFDPRYSGQRGAFGDSSLYDGRMGTYPGDTGYDGRIGGHSVDPRYDGRIGGHSVDPRYDGRIGDQGYVDPGFDRSHRGRFRRRRFREREYGGRRRFHRDYRFSEFGGPYSGSGYRDYDRSGFGSHSGPGYRDRSGVRHGRGFGQYPPY